MYLFNTGSARERTRGKSNRHRAKLKAKNRRRVNRAKGRKLSSTKRR